MRDTDVAGQQPAHVEAVMPLNDVWLLNVLRVSVPGSRQFKREIWDLTSRLSQPFYYYWPQVIYFMTGPGHKHIHMNKNSAAWSPDCEGSTLRFCTSFHCRRRSAGCHPLN